jgi:hypothetical protein
MSKNTPARRLSSGTLRRFRAPKQRRILELSRTSAVASGNRLLRTLAPPMVTFVSFSPTGSIALSVCAVSTQRGRELATVNFGEYTFLRLYGKWISEGVSLL